MSTRPRKSLWVLLGGLVVAAVALVGLLAPWKAKPVTAAAAPVAPSVTAEPVDAPVPPSPWCGEGTESLPSDVCYIDGRGAAGRRTLVIWLHGVIGVKTNWSHDHEKMLSRVAKSTGVEVLFPKGILEDKDAVYGWPETAEDQAEHEEALIAQWMTAKARLEKREGKAFDETFIFGFSSGAYFASSLAMRGRVDVDGYGVFAGGQPTAPSSAPLVHVAPVFVGVCADDATTATHSRAFAGSLAAAGIPFTVNEQPVSHDLSPAHFTGALSFLRAKSHAQR